MDLPDAIDRMRRSTVQIAVFYPRQARPVVLGSGVIVDASGLVATASHVIDAAQQHLERGADLRVQLAVPDLEMPDGPRAVNGFMNCRASVAAADRDADVAVLELAPNPVGRTHTIGIVIGMPERNVQLSPIAAECDASRPREGEFIATSGYPFGHPALITTAGHIACVWVDAFLPDEFGVPRSQYAYLAGLTVNPGNSGGPVYRIGDGRLIGICIACRTAGVHFADGGGGSVAVDGRPVGVNSGLAVITPIEKVLNLAPVRAAQQRPAGAAAPAE